tara:strand:+ start:1143 stop:1640 length:498 start_codon:yes stop_codon:yes gene_type:complete
MVRAILACDEDGGVSKNGTLPWPKNKKDLAWFKKNTTNSTVVMGSKTWKDPLMPWPLPHRKNVLATSRKEDFPGADAYIKGDLCREIKKLSKEDSIWVIGGVNVFEQTIETVEEVYLSRIPGRYACDGFLPLNKIKNMFEKTWTEKHETVEFQIWKKRKKVEAVS